MLRDDLTSPGVVFDRPIIVSRLLFDFGQAAVAKRRKRLGVHVVRTLIVFERAPQPPARILPAGFPEIETRAQGQPAHEPDLFEPPRFLDLNRPIKRHPCDVVLPVQHVYPAEADIGGLKIGFDRDRPDEHPRRLGIQLPPVLDGPAHRWELYPEAAPMLVRDTTPTGARRPRARRD